MINLFDCGQYCDVEEFVLKESTLRCLAHCNFDNVKKKHKELQRLAIAW